jgi:indole-3-glycerol phosphate synthase
MSGYLARIGGDVRRDAPEPTRGFAEAIATAAAVAVIAEVKRSSPSQGPIAPDADIAGTAVRYESGGAACLSVLCAERDFGGSLDHLRKARSAVSIPAIAKDFTVFPQQVAEQRLAGADAILVILAMVTDQEARRLMETAVLLGMDALVETHDRAEIERADALEARLVGVNARDLETLEIDRDRQLELLAALPAGVVRVAESGIASRADVESARDAGADAVLVGTALMREPSLLAELVGVPRG